MASDPLLNRVFDRRYLVLRKLGSGGMADVYLAEDQELGRKVALKMLNERHARDEQFVERFRREAQNAAGLGHPNIVQIFDRGQAEGTYYIAMEYLDGPTLKELLVKHRQAPIQTSIEYARQILEALAFAHRHGIVHRDIKPHNIVFGSDKRLKVTDFGIARSGTSQMTEVGSIVGTAQYLSPEQARGAPVDPRSDLYSLGIVLYELLTGEVPFSGDVAVEVAMKHLSTIPDPPSKLRPDVPRDLDAVVMRALAKEPDQRYDSAEDMAADLDRVARGVAIAPQTEEAMTLILSATSISSAATMISPRGTPPPAPPAYRKPGYYDELPRRRRFWPWLLGLLAIAIVGIAGFLLYQQIQSQIDTNRTIAVQNVGRLKKANAVELLVAQGLQVAVERASSDIVPAGSVISQNPDSGVKVAKDSTVTIVVSSGTPTVIVQAVIGMSVDLATSTLTNVGLTVDRHDVYSAKPLGTVIAQDPPAVKDGQPVKAAAGSTVRINVSRGQQLLGVPNVIGDPIANAKSTLMDAGFKVVEVDVNAAEPAGNVIDQSPAANADATPGSTVTITVSKGPKTVSIPYLIGDNVADAEQLLQQKDLVSSVVEQEVTVPSQDGLVLDQIPAKGSVEQGTTIALTVGHYTAATTPTTATTTVVTTTVTPPPVVTTTP